MFWCRDGLGWFKEGRVFFFEKKKQKTLAQLASAFPRRLSRMCKSFLVLFLQKRRVLLT
jgi:hypothetical protein